MFWTQLWSSFEAGQIWITQTFIFSRLRRKELASVHVDSISVTTSTYPSTISGERSPAKIPSELRLRKRGAFLGFEDGDFFCINSFMVFRYSLSLLLYLNPLPAIMKYTLLEYKSSLNRKSHPTNEISLISSINVKTAAVTISHIMK